MVSAQIASLALTMSVKDNQLIFRCFECKKNYNKDFNKELINRFASTHEFCNKDFFFYIDIYKLNKNNLQSRGIPIYVVIYLGTKKYTYKI